MKKIVLILILLPMLSKAQNTLTNGLIAYYKFDGNLADSSGNNNHGTNFGSQFTTDKNNISSKAVNFNGTSAYINVPASTSLNSVQNELSIAAWVNITDWYHWAEFSYAALLCKSNTSSSTQYRFSLLNNAFDVISNQKKFYKLIPTSFDTGTWYHVAIAKKADSCILYVNGNVMQTAVTEGTFPSDSTKPLEIGRDYAGSMEYYNGKMDELRIYNRALTSVEVTAIYNNVNTSIHNAKVTPISNLVIYPNPSNGIFHLNVSALNVQKIEVFNHIGQIVFNSNQALNEINLSYLNKGVYFVKVTDSKESIFKSQLVIE
ncbi:MAG: LamG-like jellyroll fold domain-containing protein [Bacteroidota bacterium]